jgi:hypothetical protein
MLFCAINLHDLAAPPGREEEVFVVVPGAAKTAIAVPLDALARFLPLLEQAVGRDAWPQCPECGAAIPRLKQAMCPGSHCAPGDPG